MRRVFFPEVTVMANCGQYLWSTTIFILSWLAMTRAQTQCPTAPNMNVTEKLNAAQIILYGIETTQLPECQGDIGHCSRTDIDFAVHCVLKNEAGVDIPASITIRGEPVRILKLEVDGQIWGVLDKYIKNMILIVYTRKSANVSPLAAQQVYLSSQPVLPPVTRTPVAFIPHSKNACQMNSFINTLWSTF